MPNFGFNPFAPRINVYTTGVETGDARRYHSRDVIRTGGERVEIDATLTPGEAGKRQKTQFEKKITEMVQKEKEFVTTGGKKLEFVNGERIRSSEAAFFGLKTYDEYVSLKKEDKRRQELSLYQLSDKEIDQIIAFEKQQENGYTPSIRQLYDKIELLKQSYETDHSSVKDMTPLHEKVDQSANDFLSFQRIKNPILQGHSNRALQKAEEGIVDTHLPRVNMKVMLDAIDREFIKQHPIIKEGGILPQVKENTISAQAKENILSTESKEREAKRIHISQEEFHNVNKPLQGEIEPTHQTTTMNKPLQGEIEPINMYSKEQPTCNSGTPTDHTLQKNKHDLVKVTDEYIQSHRMPESELKTLSIMKNYTRGIINNTLFIRNLPKHVTCQELIELFGRFESPNEEMPRIQYTLLTGRMRGQAFVTFCNSAMATSALELLQGFIYQGKPLIIQYKRLYSKV